MFGLKQFRRRQLFNFTLTELILLILFILLLFLWFKNVDLEKKQICQKLKTNKVCENNKLIDKFCKLKPKEKYRLF